MIKRFTLLFSVLIVSVAGFAQVSASDFSVALAGNYTMYKGDFQKSTPGVKLEFGYGIQKKVAVLLGFTKGFSIKTASSITSMNETGETKTTSSDIKTSFSTISLNVQYRIVGDEDSDFKFYAPIGGSYVMAKSSETPNESIPSGYTAMDQMESSSANGMTINLGLGAHYRFGAPMVFAEGQIALPANKVNNTTVENVIPAHFLFNLGVRFSLGGKE